jgi:hypothetical protein
LKYIGVLETAQGRVAVFRDLGGDIVNGKEGDIIDGRYRLLKIGVESADVAYVGRTGPSDHSDSRDNDACTSLGGP